MAASLGVHTLLIGTIPMSVKNILAQNSTVMSPEYDHPHVGEKYLGTKFHLHVNLIRSVPALLIETIPLTVKNSFAQNYTVMST